MIEGPLQHEDKKDIEDGGVEGGRRGGGRHAHTKKLNNNVGGDFISHVAKSSPVPARLRVGDNGTIDYLPM